MKKVLIIIMCLIMCGCENKEIYKEQYINYKKMLFSSNIFIKEENLPFNINIKLTKNESLVDYLITIDKSKEELNNIQVLVVHNQITNDVFPSIGIFNEKQYLNPNEDNKISLNGNFETTKNIEDVVVEFKFIIKFTDKEGNNRVIYYKTTK